MSIDDPRWLAVVLIAIGLALILVWAFCWWR
jgi:hypothetical protein